MNKEKNLDDYKKLQEMSPTPKVTIDREKNSVKVEGGKLKKDIDDFKHRIKKLEEKQIRFQKKLEHMDSVLKRVVDFKKNITSKMPDIDANNSR
jgi:predicted  nucleic acid-binding Zn-ribbon protein